MASGNYCRACGSHRLAAVHLEKNPLGKKLSTGSANSPLYRFLRSVSSDSLLGVFVPIFIAIIVITIVF